MKNLIQRQESLKKKLKAFKILSYHKLCYKNKLINNNKKIIHRLKYQKLYSYLY